MRTKKIDNSLAFQYHREILPQFASIYNPILETGLFSFVGYFRIYADGRYLLPVGKEAQIIEGFFNNVRRQGPYHLDYFRRVNDFSIAPWPDRPSALSEKDQVVRYLNTVNLEGVSINKRHLNHIEGIYVCAPHKEANFNAMVLSNANFFQDLLLEVSKKAASILDLKKDGFARFEQSIDMTPHPGEIEFQHKMDNLLSRLREGSTPRSQKNIPFSLSPRQIQLILVSLNGQTSREAAQSLSLSHRTVDDYWAALQSKFMKNTGRHYSRPNIIKFFLDHAESYLDDFINNKNVRNVEKYHEKMRFIENFLRIKNSNKGIDTIL